MSAGPSKGFIHFSSRALIADDDPVLRRLMRSRLAGIVDEVIEAEDGIEAWQHLVGERFHVAIVDLMMPSLNGFALIQCMRGHPRTRHLPIVVVTSSDDAASIQRALEVGASAVITKPVAWATFKSHLQHLMRLAAEAEGAERTVERSRAVSSSQAALFEAMAALARSPLFDQHRASAEHAAGVRERIDRLSAAHAAIGSIGDAKDGYVGLSAVIDDTLRVHQERAPQQRRIVSSPDLPLVELLGSREALVAALSSAIKVVSRRIGAEAPINLFCALTGDELAIAVIAPALGAVGLPAEEIAVDLAAAAAGDEDSGSFDIALARTLIAAHGGSLSRVDTGLLATIPTDRLRPVPAIDTLSGEPVAGDLKLSTA